MANDDEKTQFYIKNPNNDFALVQNYVIQLVAESKLTPSAFVLYTFYQSLNGFSTIKVGYRYIKENTGISTGNVSKCNDLLEKCGLIKKIDNGYKRAFTIELTPNHLIPRRVLKTIQEDSDEADDSSSHIPAVHSVNCSSDESENQKMNTESKNCSPDEHIQILQQDSNYTNTTITTAPAKIKTKKLDTKLSVSKEPITFNESEAKFIDNFVEAWKIHSKSKYYTKNDFGMVKKLIDIEDASKYIEILWCLDDIDDWVRKSDHSLSIFVKEYKSGRLQALYPNTIYCSPTQR